MAEHLRALVVVVGLALVVFFFARGPACLRANAPADFDRRRNVWFGVTLAIFLAHNFWLYMFAAAAVLVVGMAGERNRLALFLGLLLAVPAIGAPIAGVAGINHFFIINYYRLLALIVLLPACVDLWRDPRSERFGSTLPDKLFAAYLVLQLLLIMKSNTLTNALRYGVFYGFVDHFLPYYVASRALRDMQGFRDALMAYAVGAGVMAAVGVFEVGKSWLLYAALEDALGVPWNLGNYLPREDTLRATATAGHPLALGYVIGVGLGLFLFLRACMPPLVWALGCAALGAGLLSPLSRGPAAGALAIVLAFVATGRSGFVATLAKWAFGGLVAFSVLMATPASDYIIEYLSVLGSIDTYNITYRVRLLLISLEVIMQSPLFGAYDFYLIPEFQELKQGQGIIDIVNTYVGVGLASGVAGVSLFCAFFGSVIAALVKAIRKLPAADDERLLLGRALLATLLGVLLMIFTISNIVVVPIIYWSVAGLCVGYVRMLAVAPAAEAARAAAALRPVTAGR